MSADWFKLVQQYNIHFNLYYSWSLDWCLKIWKTGAGGVDTLIFHIQNCDISYVLAKGEVAIKEWLLENNGGY